MAIKFTSSDHKYVSLDTEAPIDWMSVTTFVAQFKPHFDSVKVAEACSRKKASKWYKLPVSEILEIWESESKRATDLGTWYHNQREKDVLACATVMRDGVDLPIFHPIEKNGMKFAPEQVLKQGIYPEHLVYLKSAGICGQADRVEVINNKIDVYDYKTNKEIKQKGFTNWEGTTKMMLGPCAHLEDCNFNHYALQLSTYLYIILKHNHYLDPGKLEIHHVTFETSGEDKYGYPITLRDSRNEPVVKHVEAYQLPFLKSEVINMIKYTNESRKNGN